LPYVLPMLFVMLDGEVVMHTTAAHGHFRAIAADACTFSLQTSQIAHKRESLRTKSPLAACKKAESRPMNTTPFAS